MRVPEVTFKTRVRDESVEGPNPFRWEDRTSAEIFDGRRVVLFALPGAFTPTCSSTHLPGYEALHDCFTAHGIDEVVCLSVNDAFVMGAWADSQNTGTEIRMLADGDGAFAEAAGLVLDLTGHGLGVRSQRFAIVARDGVVERIEVEPDPTEAEATGAERTLEHL